MAMTKHDVAEMLAAHLRRERSLDELVAWAESALMDAEIDPDSAAVIAAVLGRLGVADVRAFGLTWEDCQDLLHQLGYTARVEIVGA